MTIDFMIQFSYAFNISVIQYKQAVFIFIPTLPQLPLSIRIQIEMCEKVKLQQVYTVQ